MNYVKVKKSPFKEDEGLPWVYTEKDFCVWVWETFLDGYKQDVDVPSAQVAIGHLRSMCFEVCKCDEKAYAEAGDFFDDEAGFNNLTKDWGEWSL